MMKKLSYSVLFALLFAACGENDNSANTLTWMGFSRSRILTQRSDYKPFLPIEGVTIGQTNTDDLKSLGFHIGGDGYAVTKNRPFKYFKYNTKIQKPYRN